jgi:hypothetical protein
MMPSFKGIIIVLSPNNNGNTDTTDVIMSHVSDPSTFKGFISNNLAQVIILSQYLMRPFRIHGAVEV